MTNSVLASKKLDIYSVLAKTYCSRYEP